MANDIGSAVDMIKDLLSSPDASEKISSLLSALGSDTPSESAGQDGGLDLSGLAGLLGNSSKQPEASEAKAEESGLPALPVASIMKLTNEYQKLSRQEDPRIVLLRALRPYLRPHRLSNLDNAIKILNLVKLAPLLGELKDVL